MQYLITMSDLFYFPWRIMRWAIFLFIIIIINRFVSINSLKSVKLHLLIYFVSRNFRNFRILTFFSVTFLWQTADHVCRAVQMKVNIFIKHRKLISIDYLLFDTLLNAIKLGYLVKISQTFFRQLLRQYSCTKKVQTFFTKKAMRKTFVQKTCKKVD